jgi:hypothetical protein
MKESKLESYEVGMQTGRGLRPPGNATISWPLSPYISSYHVKKRPWQPKNRLHAVFPGDDGYICSGERSVHATQPGPESGRS